jgi:hypothetical protein
MKIKMKVDAKASANENGSMTMTYKAGQVYNMESKWQMQLATRLLNKGKADKSLGSKTTKVVEDMEKKATKTKKSILKKVFGKKKK